MYISVATQVHELIKEQQRLRDAFTLHDQTERELQTTLALAINNSQDHERTYREKNKYLSLITGVVGGLLGLLGSSINNWRHRKDIKVFASNISNQVNDLQNTIIKLNSVVLPNTKDLQGSIQNQTDELLSEIKVQQEVLQENLKAMKSALSDSVFHACDADKCCCDLTSTRMLNQLEGTLNSKLNYHTSLNVGLISSLIVLGTVVLYISNTR
ncbi:uncharacterized protein CDAR_426321 [Caerostris darwini]|uniref:Uncharacterized protein n=1 Tax=Caerostris darwini TaxID=1538125 RepID=A0AAV4VT86_9ARAC|nr:uncharacterized protein CDAR_426321 [Caerostris darwini]